MFVMSRTVAGFVFGYMVPEDCIKPYNRRKQALNHQLPVSLFFAFLHDVRDFVFLSFPVISSRTTGTLAPTLKRPFL